MKKYEKNRKYIIGNKTENKVGNKIFEKLENVIGNKIRNIKKSTNEQIK